MGTKCQHSETEKENNCPKFWHWWRPIPAILTPIQFLVPLHALLYVLADILKAFCFWDTSPVVYPQDALCTVNTDQKPQRGFSDCMQILQKCKHIISSFYLSYIFQTKSPLHNPGQAISFVTAVLATIKSYPTPFKGEPSSENWGIPAFLGSKFVAQTAHPFSTQVSHSVSAELHSFNQVQRHSRLLTKNQIRILGSRCLCYKSVPFFPERLSLDKSS